MSVSKWAYTPEKCDGQPCPGDCDHCAKQSLYEMKEFFDGIGLKDTTGLMDTIVPKMILEGSEDESRSKDTICNILLYYYISLYRKVTMYIEISTFAACAAKLKNQ